MKKGVLYICIFIVLLSAIAYAIPPTPYQVWGIVLINGEAPEDGLDVEAYCDDELYYSATIVDAYYALDIPGDDPDTAEKDGCYNDETVIIKIDGYTASPELEWESGGEEVDLTVDFGCDCSSWQDISCGSGSCDFDEIYQIRSCNPGGCGSESRCVFDSSCNQCVTDSDCDDNDECTVDSCDNGDCTYNNNPDCEERGFRISEVEVKVDGKKENVDNGDKIRREAEPGSSVRFTVEVENLVNSDLEDVEFTITIEDIDDGDDLEEDEKISDIRPGRKKSKSVEFEIPLEVDKDEFDVIIEVNAEDEDNNEYTEEWELILEVDKEKHNVIILDANLFPVKVECGKRSELSLKMLNLGSEDEENLLLSIRNDKLGLLKQEIFDLDEAPGKNSKFSKAYNLVAKEAGLYPIFIKVFDDDNELMDSTQLELEVECEKEQEETEPEKPEITKRQVKEEKIELPPLVPPAKKPRRICFLFWCWYI